MKRQWALTTTSIDELNTPSFVVHAPTLTFKADTTKIRQSKSNQDLVLDHAIPEIDGNDHSNEIVANEKLEKTKKKNGKKEETMNLSKSTPNLLHATSTHIYIILCTMSDVGFIIICIILLNIPTHILDQYKEWFDPCPFPKPEWDGLTLNWLSHNYRNGIFKMPLLFCWNQQEESLYVLLLLLLLSLILLIVLIILLLLLLLIAPIPSYLVQLGLINYYLLFIVLLYYYFFYYYYYYYYRYYQVPGSSSIIIYCNNIL